MYGQFYPEAAEPELSLTLPLCPSFPPFPIPFSLTGHCPERTHLIQMEGCVAMTPYLPPLMLFLVHSSSKFIQVGQ